MRLPPAEISFSTIVCVCVCVCVCVYVCVCMYVRDLAVDLDPWVC
jgi:hypothetical protein